MVSPKAQETATKIDKIGVYQNLKLCALKDTIKKMMTTHRM